MLLYCVPIGNTIVNQRLLECVIGQHQAYPRPQIQNKVPQQPVMADVSSSPCPWFDMRIL